MGEGRRQEDQRLLHFREGQRTYTFDPLLDCPGSQGWKDFLSDGEGVQGSRKKNGCKILDIKRAKKKDKRA